MLELPPLARGREPFLIMAIFGEGITPARAGKSLKLHREIIRGGNYPRSRGEEFVKVVVEVPVRELPPLARGRVSPFFLSL